MFDKKKMLKRVQSRNQIQQRNAENLIPYRTVGSFSSSFKKSVKDKAMNAGKHAVYLHQNNYPLASDRLIPEVCLNSLCMSMLSLQNVSLDDVLYYKALVDNDRTKLTSKLLNSYKTAMISISDGKLHILSVSIPSKKGGARNRQTHKIPIAPFGTNRRLSNHSNGSRLSIGSTRGNSDNPFPVAHGSSNSPQPSSVQRHGSSRRSFQSDRDSNDGTSVSFSLSHIYDIDIAKPGSREFTVVFYYPLNDSDTPPTTNFQLITLTFKADSPEKAVAWIKHLLVAVESVNKLTVAFAQQILRDEERIGKEQMDLAMLKRCQEYLRLNIDLWSIIKGFYSESVANSMIALGEFLKSHGDEEEESHFWLDYAEKIMVVVDKHKSKKELARSYIDLLREEVETNGVL